MALLENAFNWINIQLTNLSVTYLFAAGTKAFVACTVFEIAVEVTADVAFSAELPPDFQLYCGGGASNPDVPHIEDPEKYLKDMNFNHFKETVEDVFDDVKVDDPLDDVFDNVDVDDTIEDAWKGAKDKVEDTVDDVFGSSGKTNFDAPNTGGMCSFSSNTEVATEAGSIPIGELEEGDKVLAYNEATGETGEYEVTAVWSHEDEVVFLTIDGEVIETTSDHPFYTQEQGWTAVEDLEAGFHVRRADGSYGVVEAVSATILSQPMFNLTVDEAHTYFVGDEQWLVHNDCYGPIEINGKKIWGFRNVQELISHTNMLRNMVRGLGIEDAVIGIRGSAVTNLSSKFDTPFRWDDSYGVDASDVDYFIISKQIEDVITQINDPLVQFKDGKRMGSDILRMARNRTKLLHGLADVIDAFEVKSQGLATGKGNVKLLKGDYFNTLDPSEYVVLDF